MKVYLQPPIWSRGLLRIADNLINYIPNHVGMAVDEAEADLVILYVYGRHDSVEKKINELKDVGKAYAIIQCVLRSSMRPNTKDWIHMWNDAKLVWSYYDLPQLTIEDGVRFAPFNPPNFYHAPLGADPDVFQPTRVEKKYIIAASGQHALSESVRECAFAAKRVGKKMLHIGHELRRGDDIECKSGMDDETLAFLYSQSHFVSGLRRIEGFELPAAEGLLCGARPILFDRPHYRKWYEGLAVFIPEGNRDEVIDSLEEVFTNGYMPVSDETIEEAKRRFNWQTIIKGFWDRVL